MDAPKSPEPTSPEPIDAYNSLIKLLKSRKKSLKFPSKKIVVDRGNIFEDILLCFKEIGDDEKVFVQFKSESSSGNGVSRDAFTCFMESVSAKFERENEKFPPADMDINGLGDD